MEGNPKLFTEDQAREFKEFLSREKTLLEDKAKKVGMLESELRSLKANVDEVAHKYDEALQVAGRKGFGWGGCNERCSVQARFIDPQMEPRLDGG